jgi:energy-coupling factor transport system permease protein
MYSGSFFDLDAPLQRINPSAKLLVGVVALLSMTLVFDPLTPALAIVLALAVLCGLGRISLLSVANVLWPAMLAALGFFWVGIAFPRASESVTLVIQIGQASVSAEALWRAGAIALRVLCFGVFSLLLMLTTSPTDLMLALVQHWRVPPAIAYAAMAGYRFIPLFAREAESIHLAHRVRGIGLGRGPRGRLEAARRFAIPLLASAIRRAERVAIAMESRGFDGRSRRTVYRTLRWRRADVLFVLLMLAAFGAIFTISHSLGVLRLWDGTTF